MKHILQILPIVLALSLAAFGDTPTGDAKALAGTWLPTKAELGGEPMPDAFLKAITLKLDNGKYEVLVGDKPDRGTYTLDPAAAPKGMSIPG